MKIHNLFWIVWWVVGVILLVGLVLRFWTGDDLMLSRYAGYLMPWLLVGLLPGALWAGLMHHRGLSFLLGGSAIIIFVAYAPLFMSRPEVSDQDTPQFKVLSYNIWSKNLDISRAAGNIHKQRPDIVLLQEVTPKAFHKLEEYLADLYSGEEVHFFYEPSLLLMVVSRYPADFSLRIGGKGRVQKIGLRSPVGLITVFNVHLLRRGGWQSRYNKIFSLLQEEVAHEAGAVILGGDFNTPDQSQTYNVIKKFLDNAHWEAGFGFGFSFPTSAKKLFGLFSAPALIRIDHIFFNNHLVALCAATIKDSGGSDHFPVMAVLGLK